MMRILLLSLLLVSPALAQVHPRVSDFIPPDWEIESSLKADLTGDSIPDEALLLIEHMKDGTYKQRQVMVLKNRDTGYELIGSNTEAVLWALDSDLGSVRFGDTEAIHLRVKNGCLILHQIDGDMSTSGSEDFTFRYDPLHNRMRLTEYVFDVGARFVGDRETSKNYVTGIRIDRNTTWNNDEEKKLKPKKRKIPKRTIWMENAKSDYE